MEEALLAVIYSVGLRVSKVNQLKNEDGHYLADRVLLSKVRVVDSE